MGLIMFANFDIKMYGAALLIAGTAIGAGMLSLPISLGVGGIIGSTFIMVVGFLYMLAAFFLLLEILSYHNETKTIAGVSLEYLGKWGEMISWGSFLCLLYLASAAYINGVVDILQPMLPDWLRQQPTAIAIVFTGIIGVICTYGVVWLDHLNRFLMGILVLSFLSLVFLIAPHIQVNDNLVGEPIYLIRTIPLVVLSFTSHIILPSIIPYLNHNIQRTKKAIVIGSMIPLVLYLIWIYLIVLLLPFNGPGSIMEISGLTSSHLSALSRIMSENFSISSLGALNTIFSFFAMLTSFLGVTISVADSITDGFKLKGKPYHHFLRMPLTLLPPLLIVFLKPAGFIAVLSYGGMFFAIAYGIVPAIIAWVARYHHGHQSRYTLPGGKASLIFIGLVATMIVALVILNAQGLLPTP